MMALRKLTIYQKVLGAFGLGLLVVIFVHILDYKTSEELIESFEEVEEMHEIILRLEEARSLLKDVQRAHRGYIISGQEAFLEPYFKATKKIPPLLLLLEQDLLHHAPQKADFRVLQQLIARNVAFADASIALVRQGKQSEAFESIGQGKLFFDQLNLMLDRMKDREQEHLASVRKAAEYYAYKNRIIVLAALLSSVLLLLLALRYIARDIHQIQALKGSLEEANNDLAAYNEELLTLNQSLAENQDRLLEVQQALQLREEQLLEAQAISKTGSFDWNIADNTVRYTKEYARIFRIKEGETYTYQGFLSRLHPEDRERVDRVVQASVEKKSAYQIEYRLNFPDQQLHVQVNARPYYKEGKAAGLLGTVADITPFKEAQAKLKAQKEQFSALLESAPDAMVIVDAEGKIKLTNLQAENLFGYPGEAMVGQPVEMLLAGRNHALQYIKETLDSARKAPKKREGQEVTGLTAGGVEIPVELSISLIKTKGATLIAAAMRDISQRKEAAQRLRDAYLALENSNYALAKANAELDTFSYSISHDLRAPLRAISGYSAILKEEFGHVLGEKGGELADIIRLNTNRMGALIWGLLEFSKYGKKAVSKQTFDMQQLLQQVLTEKPLKEHTKLRVDDFETVQGDPVLLRQVWENLIGNALKFSAHEQTPEIIITYSRAPDRQVFCIKDNGVGFDPAYAQDLFQVFKRLHADTDFEGTGAGLAIAKRIVEAHAGEIWADSRPGEGATFCFSLPIDS